MSHFKTLSTKTKHKIAYHKTKGRQPGILFLGGFMSNMDGTKALHLESWCKAQNRAFLRFDYSGHGQSSEAFTDGCIGDWAQDAQDVLEHLTDGPQILVGSSMGGWIALLLARRMPSKVAGLVTIAAAPDFTEDGFWESFNASTRNALQQDGVINVPSDYGDPYPITRRLIEDGRTHLVLRDALNLDIPTRFLQGDCDTDVSVETAQRLFNHVSGSDVHLSIIKGADHSFSSARCLAITEQAIVNVLARLETNP